MDRKTEIKILIDYLIDEIHRVSKYIQKEGKLNGRTGDHLTHVKELVTDMENYRKEWNTLVNDISIKEMLDE